MTITALRAAIGIKPDQSAIGHLTANVPGVLFIIKTKKTCRYIGIVSRTASPDIRIDQRNAGIILQRLIKHNNTGIGQRIHQHSSLSPGNCILKRGITIVGDSI